MKKILLFLVLITLFSPIYAFSVESKEVAHQGEAIDILLKIQPDEVDKISMSTSQKTNLVQWTMPHKEVLYNYESRGASNIHVWEFTERNTKQLTLTTKVQFNEPGDNFVYIYYEKGKESSLITKEVWVTDQSLCGNKRCDENEELTCPEDCPKFELPKIPSWVLPVSIIILIIILVVVFIKLRYWY